jgi:hypothetical protein
MSLALPVQHDRFPNATLQDILDDRCFFALNKINRTETGLARQYGLNPSGLILIVWSEDFSRDGDTELWVGITRTVRPADGRRELDLAREAAA